MVIYRTHAQKVVSRAVFCLDSILFGQYSVWAEFAIAIAIIMTMKKRSRVARADNAR